tara:strand:+ start:379 stop:756 length:378 start_codon:yes stop_codon:yes gene_type:complete
MTIKVVLLKSGEDVIADVKEMVSPEKHVVGYFLTKPCVIKMVNTDNITPEELDSKSERKSEFKVNMYPWMPISKDITIPISVDWIVTMVTPIDKIYQMYKEDILRNGKDNQSDSTTDESKTDQSD